MSFQCRIARLGLCVALCLSLAGPAVAGELNIYFGTSRDLFDPVIQAFGATRPDIKISSYRAPTEELMATIELEIKGNASEVRTEDRGTDNTGFPFYGYEDLGTDPKCTTACHDPLNEGRTLAAAYARTGKDTVGRLDRPVVGCEACHGGGSDHFGVGSLPVPRPNALRCGRCHNSVFADQKDHLKYHPEGSSIAEDYSSSPHAKAIDPKAFVPGSSADVTAECSRCHTDEGAKTYLPAVNGTESYEQVKANMAGKPAVRNASVVQCRTCHDKHNPAPSTVSENAAAGVSGSGSSPVPKLS